jgi:hypothetical protein
MNSIGNVLTNFEWDYEGPISIIRGTGYQNKGVSRTMFLTPKLADIPEQLFALKVSQSTNPARAGKLVFKYFSYRFDENAKYENTAPESVSLDTPLSEVKNLVVSKIGNIPNAQISVNVALHGSFTNVSCADGTYAIFDKEKFKNADPNKDGDAPYYIKGDAIIRVKLKGAVSQGNEYLQSTLSTTASADDIFQKVQAGKVWGEDSGDVGAAASPSTDAGAANPVW